MDQQRIIALIRFMPENYAVESFFISNIRVANNNYKLIAALPRHLTTHIKSIAFQKCELPAFPPAKTLLDLTQNLQYLSMVGCRLNKISREDLYGLECLLGLHLGENKIEELPKGLFDYAPKLHWVSFRMNKIKTIDAHILDSMHDLQHVDLTGNIGIDCIFDTYSNKGNVTLEQLKEEIRKCDPNEKFKAEMHQEIQQLKACIISMGNEHSKLKRKLCALEKNCNEQTAEIKKLKENPVLNNVTVIINGKAFRVNKTILATNSPLLAKLIVENPSAEQLELHDLPVEIFKVILKFMHDKNVPDDATNLTELYDVSAKLEMKELMDLTACLLKDKVTLENANDIMKLAMKFGHEELRKKAFEELKKSFDGN